MKEGMVKKKEDIKEFCKWFLKNVKSESLAREMSSFAISHRIAGNNISLTSDTIAGVMKTHPEEFERRKEHTSNKKGVKGAILCYWSLKGGK